MIAVTNLSKSYGTQVLFENVTFNINPGEKIGLVGRNGHGKTTLFRLITGQEEPDSGTITIPKGYKIGYLKQQLEFTEPTVLAECCSEMQPNDSGVKQTWQAEKILSGLGFSKEDMQRPPQEFSGGFQVRINLTKLLVSEPNLLLLDEPGNYLDIISIRWLISFLRSWHNELVIISHDRSLMDAVTTHTLAIHRQNVKKIAGDTAKMYDQIAREEEIYEKTRINDDKRRKEIETFIERFRYKATLASRVQSRVKTLDKMSKVEALEKIKNLDFAFNYEPMFAKSFFGAEHLSFGYGGTQIIRDLSFEIKQNDRVGIIGKNGKGKTTLLKLLAGKLQPQSGVVNAHPAVKIGFFEQTNVQTLDPQNTVEQEIDSAIRDRERYTARAIAGAMMFEGDNSQKRIGVLSGGEKNRVMLGKLIATPCNLLLLDEPTNHLDMQSADSLLAALDAFEGAVVIATHNEMFLRTLVNKLIIFDHGGITVYNGGYDDFLREIGWDNETDDRAEPGSLKPVVSKKDTRKWRADIVAQKSKELKPIENQMNKLEDEITSLESESAEVSHSFEQATMTGDAAKIRELSQRMSELDKHIESLYERLSVLSDTYDEKKKYYDEML